MKLVAAVVTFLFLGIYIMHSQEVRPPFEIQVEDFKTYSFEDNESGDFNAGPGSKLSISSKYFKAAGQKSLCWEWDKPGAYITFKNPDAFKHLTGEAPDDIVYDWVTFCQLSAISVWIFSEEVKGGRLWFEIGDGKNIDCRFYFNLNYSGWRELKAFYGRDIDGFPGKNADTLTIHAPDGVSKGKLYIDLFAPRRELDVRFVRATEQMPYVRNKTLCSTDILDKLPTDAKPETIGIPLQKLTDEQKKILRKLEQKFLRGFERGITKNLLTEKEQKQVLAIREKYHLKRNGRFVDGIIGNPMKFYGDMFRAASAYRRAGTPETKNKMLDLYMDMCDLVVQHGHGAWYGLRTSFVAPLLAMKPELTASGRYAVIVDKLKHISGVDDLYLKEPWGNADDYNTELRARVCLILMQLDDSRKWADLEALKYWMNYTVDSGEMKPDGTFFHHGMIYSGYNLPAIGPICQIVGLLHGTPFFPDKMYRIARKTLINMSYYSNDAIPHMFSGRWRTCSKFTWNYAQNFKTLAECGDPENGRVPDRETAALYLYYADRFGKSNKTVDEYRKLGIKPTVFDGHKSLNYAVSSIHRRKDWMAVMRGMRNGIEVNESYANQGGNTMGRYINYGQIQIFAHDNVLDDGFPESNWLTRGWNYNFWPGTTSRVIPPEALRQHFENVEYTTTEFFAGGASLDGNGIFGMKLQEELPLTNDPLRLGPPLYWLGQKEYDRRCKVSKFDTTFRARKSMFFFDDMIVALGSGIRSEDREHDVVTTLFQNALQDKNKNNYSDSDASKTFPDEKTLTGPGWIISAVGLGYYIPAGNDTVRIIRKKVDNTYHKNWLPNNAEKHNEMVVNKGEVELAFLEHGKSPDNKGYEYCIVVRPELDRMKRFAAEMSKPETAPYRVLCRNNRLHAVYNAGSRTTGYVLFEAGDVDAAGLLKAVDKPCLVMIRDIGDKLRISLLNPDFDDYSKFGAPVQNDAPVKLSLHGKWKLINNNTKGITQHDASTFTVRGKDVEPVIFELEKSSDKTAI